jgi:hypothetical protein
VRPGAGLTCYLQQQLQQVLLLVLLLMAARVGQVWVLLQAQQQDPRVVPGPAC